MLTPFKMCDYYGTCKFTKTTTMMTSYGKGFIDPDLSFWYQIFRRVFTFVEMINKLSQSI
jgi:hypothetical protein